MNHLKGVRLTTWALVARMRSGVLEVLVQFDSREQFYRLPGGGVELGETAALALEREFLEEYNLRIQVGPLIAVREHVRRHSGRLKHEVTLVHSGALVEGGELWIHRERPGVRLAWRSESVLASRTVYPVRLLSLARSALAGARGVVHLIEMNPAARQRHEKR